MHVAQWTTQVKRSRRKEGLFNPKSLPRQTLRNELIGKMDRKSRMFEGLKTWNPWVGCEHHCYGDGCWAKRKIAPRVGHLIGCKHCIEFEPHAHFDRLDHIPRQPRIFVVAHGDLFGNWVPKEAIYRILESCRSTKRQMWFFETKNPVRYLEFWDEFPENTVLSTTIETNRIYSEEIRGWTPIPQHRMEAMLVLARQRPEYPIHIAIEPVMEFDLDVMLRWMKMLQPIKVAVGYDSLSNNLPEPPKEKTFKLISELEKFAKVERKQL